MDEHASQINKESGKESGQVLYFGNVSSLNHSETHGIIVQKSKFRVHGYYKVFADTEKGQFTKEIIRKLHEDYQPVWAKEDVEVMIRTDSQGIEAVLDRLLGDPQRYEKLDHIIRLLSGSVLDPRPLLVAIPESGLATLHPSMKEEDVLKLGEKYSSLEAKYHSFIGQDDVETDSQRQL